MKILRLLASTVLLATAGTLFADPYEALDPVTGIYEGSWKTKSGQGDVVSQIRPLGDGAYDGFVLLKQGDKTVAVIKVATPKSATPGPLALAGKSAGNKSDPLAAGQIDAKINGSHLDGSIGGDLGDGTFSAKKVVKKSRTLGAKPPKGAIVMDQSKWSNFQWKVNADGSWQVEKSGLDTTEKLTDFQLHVEFRTPLMATSQGQARGNSGVYLQSVYEVQVLDSFGLYPLQINDCGSIYGVKTAAGNACLPPTQWQTYDITYHHGDGTAANPPVITIKHNGQVTIDNAKVPADKVGKGGGGGNVNGGFLMLQNHGNPVQFRNIWAQPLKNK